MSLERKREKVPGRQVELIVLFFYLVGNDEWEMGFVVRNDPVQVRRDIQYAQGR